MRKVSEYFSNRSMGLVRDEKENGIAGKFNKLRPGQIMNILNCERPIGDDRIVIAGMMVTDIEAYFW